MNLSGYQQISFWIQQTTGTLAANCSIRICTDTVGATSVNTFTIPALNATSGWHRVTINLGSAMSAAAQSIALYVDSDQAAQTFLIDNLVACKAPGTGELTHKTLIGKANSLGAGGNDTETWYAIRDITGTVVTLESLNTSTITTTSNPLGQFGGSSETVTAYSMVPSYVPLTNAGADNLFVKCGTSSSRIAISGGWDRTNMSSQTGQTWFTNAASITTMIVSILSAYADTSRLHFVNVGSNITIYGYSNTIAEMHFLHSFTGNTIGGHGMTVSRLVTSCSSSSITFGACEGSISDLLILHNTNNGAFNTNNSIGSTITLNTASLQSGALTVGNTLIHNDVTYGVSGPAQITTDVLAGTLDTGLTVAKSLEMLAAFMAGKVTVSSSGGISTYSYKKRDNSTVSFTAICSETNGTRATSGSLS